jgi:hypothetical protein
MLVNTHQDVTVRFFSRNDYNSGMSNIWTNLYKEAIPGLPASDLEMAEIRKILGVECESENQRLIEMKKLIQEHLREHPCSAVVQGVRR